MENVEYLFVYGTLLRPLHHPAHVYLEAGGEFVSNAYVYGTLYNLGEYPGFLPVGSGKVWGELYRLYNSHKVLKELDRYEGCVDSEELQEYRREYRNVFLVDGSCRDAWIYVYNLKVSDDMKIESGDYLSHCQRGANAKTRA